MILFFDVETTGLPIDYKAPVSRLENWPRLVQIAWLLTDPQGKEIAAHECIVRPSEFLIPHEATRIHGITTEVAHRDGISLREALHRFAFELGKANVLVAHNMAFDEKIVGAEFLRLGCPDFVASKPRQCTMQASTKFCRIPAARGFKWPKLEELHRKLFQQEMTGGHHALVDARACARCYFELKRLKVIA